MKKIIFFGIESKAPHQNMMHWYLTNSERQRVSLNLVLLKNARHKIFAYAFLVFRVLYGCLFRRSQMLYFSSFVMAPFAVLAVIFRVPMWVYHSQDWIQDGRNVRSRIELYVVRHAPVVIWNEGVRAKAARRLARRQKEIFVIPTYLPRSYPVPLASPDVRADLIDRLNLAGKQKPILIFAGGGFSTARLSKQLLEAFGYLDNSCGLVFTGVDSYSGFDRVISAGELSFEEVMKVSSSSDIGVLLYNYVGSFGNRYQQPGRLTEYLRCGLCIVSTPFPEVTEMQISQSFVRCVRGYDVAELAGALQNLVNLRRTEESRLGDAIRKFATDDKAYELRAKPVVDRFLEQVGSR